MKVYLTSVGCKLNQSESESWARELASLGCQVVDAPDAADLCLANTCAVTHVAARKSRQLVRRLNRSNPEAALVIAGCYAELNPEEATGLPGVTFVAGTAEKALLVQRIVQRFGITAKESTGGALPAPSGLRTRALVKIQDGCDNVCTYCVVRLARGRQRSQPVEDVLAEVLAREAEGYQEVVLTGVHIGAFGQEHGESLAGLVGTVLGRTRLPRLRLSSIEPWDVNDDLLQLWADRRLCPHLHLPLQSGCDATLQRMGRRYSTSHFLNIVERARSKIPNLAVTTDVIVGFPGEDADEFAQSLSFISEARFSRIHVFPFSVRPGTAAFQMSPKVAPEVVSQRVARMLDLGRESSRNYRSRFINTRTEVLWESERDGLWSGLTGNFLRVEARGDLALRNRITAVWLNGLTATGMHGELCT